MKIIAFSLKLGEMYVMFFLLNFRLVFSGLSLSIVNSFQCNKSSASGLVLKLYVHAFAQDFEVSDLVSEILDGFRNFYL